MKDTIQKVQTPRASASISGKAAAGIGPGAALQRLVDSSPRQLITQAQVPVKKAGTGTQPIQRAIKKLGSSEVYKRAPISVPLKYRKIVQSMIKHDERHPVTHQDFTLQEAILEAARRFNASGHYQTGRLGTRITNTKHMLKFLKSKKADVGITKRKFKKGIGPVVNVVLDTVELMEEDFKGVSFSGAASKVHKSMISRLNSFVPTLITSGTGFNLMAAEMVKQGGGMASSIKGAMFEKWSLYNVLTQAKGRVSFAKQGHMTCARSSDGFEAATGTLWDMKHYFSTNVPSDQAADYSEILTNGYVSKEGKKVSRVCYLFPSEEGAKQNAWLSNVYGFSIYHVDGGSIKKYL